MEANDTIYPRHLLTAFRTAARSGNTIFLEGPPGIGKSEICYQFAREENRTITEIRPAQWDATDAKGLPDFSTNAAGERITIWTRPGYLPTDPRSILLIEEIALCPASIQGALMELTLDRRIGPYRLPEDCMVIATGNRIEDRSGVVPMSKALGNRIQFLKLRPNNEDWERWAVRSGIRIDILAFLRWRPEALFEFDPSQKTAVFPSPRQWAKLSKTFDAIDEIGEDALSIAPQMAAGHIGPQRAAEYCSFRDMYKDLPDPRKIDSDPMGTPIPKGISARFAVSTALARSATATNAGNRLKYIERITDNGAPVREFQTIFIGDLTELKSPGLMAPEISAWIIQDKGNIRG